MPGFGYDRPAAMASVPLQTPHTLILHASTARHCLRFAFGVKHIFYDYILWRKSTCTIREVMFRARAFANEFCELRLVSACETTRFCA